MCCTKMQRSFAKELHFFSFILSLHVYLFIGSMFSLSSSKKKDKSDPFSSDDYFTYICYTVYIHNVYKHYEQYIYYTYIFVHISRISSRWLAYPLSISMLIYHPRYLIALFFIFFREYNKDLRIM